MNKKIIYLISSIIIVSLIIIGGILFYNIQKEDADLLNDNGNNTLNGTTNSSNSKVTTTATSIDIENMFSSRDLEQTADLTEAKTINITDNNDVKITSEGVYVIKGTAKEVTIYVETTKEEKVQIVLDGVSITNSSKPCIYVASADKVFITTTDSTNSMKVTGSFNYSVNTSADAVIFSKDTIVLNGKGTLNIESTANGITSKDTLKTTGGTWTINASNHGLEANDAVEIKDGTFNITAKEDGIQSENNDDQTLGYIYISGGTFTIKVEDDGIHAQTIAQITGGTFNISAREGIEATNIIIDDGNIKISATDDGINAGQKSNAYQVLITINGGNIDITMAQGDTDAIDSNGNLVINGGTININAQSAFDYDGTGELNGGNVSVNGSKVTTMTNSMMGGGGPREGKTGYGRG